MYNFMKNAFILKMAELVDRYIFIHSNEKNNLK